MGEKMIELCDICLAVKICRPVTHGWIENKYNRLAAWFPCNWGDDCNNDIMDLRSVNNE